MDKDKKIEKKIYIAIELVLLVMMIVVDNLVAKALLVLFIITFLLFFLSPQLSKIYRKKIMNMISLNYIKNNIDFYRDIIKEYSIGEISYIDGYDLDYPQDILAILLKLKLNRYIEIENNTIKKLKKPDSNLKESDKYILDNIYNGKIQLEDDESLKEIIRNEAIKDKLISKVDFKEGKMLVITILLIILGVSLSFVLCIFLSENLRLIGTIPFLATCVFVFISTNYITKESKNSWRLTKNGRNINIKLKGLKNYLQEYSIVEKRNIDELLLWEDYLIYSVMFKINKKIINEYKDIIRVESFFNI